MKIAIDGSSATGKSTVSKAVSERLGIMYLDTGAMYRAVALKAHREGVTGEGEALGKLLSNMALEVKYQDGQQRVFLDGEDVSEEIRLHHVSKLASDISAFPAVRLFLVEQQRKIAEDSDCVLDGRDIGTFVLPDAEFKFFLTADLDERARRRMRELEEKGQFLTHERVREDIEKRDYKDAHRSLAPLKKADDAIEIDTTPLTPEQVIDTIIGIVKSKG